MEYLVGAYRTIADTAFRDLDPGSEHVRAFEQGLSDIQLLGSRDQAEMAILVSQELAAAGSADLDDLLLSLRDDLRAELDLESITRSPFHIRVVSND